MMPLHSAAIGLKHPGPIVAFLTGRIYISVDLRKFTTLSLKTELYRSLPRFKRIGRQMPKRS